MLLKQSRSVPSLAPSSMHSRDLSDVESIQFTHVFPYQELEEATNGFDSKEKIGDGGFGLCRMRYAHAAFSIAQCVIGPESVIFGPD
ncbi:serine/threonine-protein kinase [Carex littledalei]|uniref:Serine/threonine-protein kinase n=1 Tax=Carex littledalei TaxID=544730 RepID=A0A833QJF7_9POAL|nr:serine/threonine-protein kinase [Carex littledalei]